MAKSKSISVKDTDPVDEIKIFNGEKRPYFSTTPSEKQLKNRSLTLKDALFIGILLLTSINIRLYDLSYPNSVVFDEVHFGSFTKKYILGKFFMDVHPPLAKMLFAMVGLFSGFKGDFSFEKIGMEYPESTPYYQLRLFPAILGIGTIVFCYLTLRASGCRQIVCFLTSGLLLIENSNITISRHILLDSPMLFFIAAGTYSFKKFENQSPFSFSWYKSLVATGVALGLAFSSKWVGLFTIVWCGVLCAVHLWFLIGDLSVSPRKVVAHAFARASVLLGIPIVIYLVSFAIHFQLLPNDGDGSPFMSSAFRATLKGNTIPRDIEAKVGLGSVVTIRHLETQGGYLHSHAHMYPTGSKQQQITLYPHLDNNNKWLIEHYNDTTPDDKLVPIHDGMKIRLKHVTSGKRLHSHDEKPPVSERDWQKEASCYGFDGFAGDANDDFVVEIVQKRTKDIASKFNVKALTTVFRLRHAMTGHYLFSSEVKLPSWGFEQQEVTTASQGFRPLTYWYVETNENARINETYHEVINYKPLTFWDKLYESHQRMWKINKGLTDHHPWQSEPTEWPLLLRGINYWAHESKHIYLLGNAPIWWSTTLCLVIFAVYVGFQVVKWQVGKSLSLEKHVLNFNYNVFSYALGWFLHYIPFYLMGRQLFLHHYLPALYYGILVLGHFFDLLLSTGLNFGTKPTKTGGKTENTTGKYSVYVLFTAFLAVSTYFYSAYSPLIYGMPWTKSQCQDAKLLNWDFECSTFPNNLNEYGFLQSSKISKEAKPNINNFEAKEAQETPSAQNVDPEPEHMSESKKEPEQENKEPVAQEEQLVPPLPDEETK